MRVLSTLVLCSPVMQALVGCTASPDPFEGRNLRAQAEGEFELSPLVVDGGSVARGTDAVLVVTKAPAMATVDLYLSRQGQGGPDCTTFAPRCLDLLSPELYDTAVSNGRGQASFVIDADDFLDTQEIVWQPIAVDPISTEDIVGWAAVRHVMVPIAEAALELVPVANEVGIGPMSTSGNTHTGGAIWFDYNDDLWTDLLVVNGEGKQNALFRNDGDGTFTKMVGMLDKPDLALEPAGAKYADIDDDQDLDVLMPVDNGDTLVSYLPQVHEGGPNLLFVNDNGTFVESAAASGLLDPRGWRNSDAAFADYDRDGCIDVLMANWAIAAIPANDNFSRLMHGNCDGTFDDVTAMMGTDGAGRDTLVAFWWDANDDRFPDLYLGNTSHQLVLPDYDPTANFYYNLGGADFEDQVPSIQPWLGLDAWAAMGADVGDVDLDGDWDLYITDTFVIGFTPRGNPFYLSDPSGTLSTNVCAEHGVCGGYNSWPGNFADFNRDTWPDLWVGGAQDDGISLVFINKGDGTFEHHEQTDFGPHFARGGSIADYDGDGDVDVFVWEHGRQSQLYRNDPVDTNHWIEVKLYGTRSTWDAIGATVYVTVDGVEQRRRVSGGDSAHSQMDAILHFGLGDADRVDRLRVEWPNGKAQTFRNVRADDLVRIDQRRGLLSERLTGALAEYDAALDTLYVEVGSTWGGRTALDVSSFGALDFDAATGVHAATFTGVATDPGMVSISSERGASANALVTVL